MNKWVKRAFGLIFLGAVFSLLISIVNYNLFDFSGLFRSGMFWCDYKEISTNRPKGEEITLVNRFDVLEIAKTLALNGGYEGSLFMNHTIRSQTRFDLNSLSEPARYQAAKSLFENGNLIYSQLSFTKNINGREYEFKIFSKMKKETIDGFMFKDKSEKCTVPDRVILGNIDRIIKDLRLTQTQNDELKDKFRVVRNIDFGFSFL